MMTNIDGKYMFCDADGSFSLTLTCTGPGCSSALGRSNLTCTQSDAGSWQCDNHGVCSGTASYASSFVITQSNETIRQTQRFSLNGTNFVFQQDGTGNATIVNATASSASANSSASGRQHWCSAPLLLIMLLLGLLLPLAQAQTGETGKEIGEAIEEIIKLFKESWSVGYFSGEDVAGKFDEIASQVCGKLISKGITAFAAPEAFGECEEAMVGFEMGLTGSALGLTLRTFAGLGGVLLEGLTAFDEAAVLAADAGVLPEVFIVNSALCGLLVSVITAGLLEGSADMLCAAVESAAARINAGHPISMPSPAPTPPTTVSTPTQSPPTSSMASSLSPNTPPSPTPGSPIPDVSGDPCAACELSLYFLGVEGLAAKCNVATPLGVGFDLSVVLCDSTYDGRYATFCSYLCAHQCVTYDIQKWIQSAGSQFWSNASLALCAQECSGFKGDGRCQTADPCPCAQGALTCEAC